MLRFLVITYVMLFWLTSFGQSEQFFWDTTDAMGSIMTESRITTYDSSIYAIGQSGTPGSNNFVLTKCSLDGSSRLMDEISLPRSLVLVTDILEWNYKLITLSSGRDSGAVSTQITYLNPGTLSIDSIWTLRDTTSSLGLEKFGVKKGLELNGTNGEFILIGMQFDPINGAIIVKLDSSKHFEWVVDYQPDTTLDYSFSDIDTLSNGKLVAKGVAQNNNVVKQFFIIIDPLTGNIENEVIWSGGGYTGYTGGVATGPNDEIIIGGSKEDYLYGGSYYRHPNLAAFDTLGNKLWERDYDKSNPRAGYYVDQLNLMKDSTLLFKCAYISEKGEIQSSLNKITISGDSLWTKYISHPSDNSSFTSVSDINELLNGDIIYSGYYLTQLNRAFIARVNENGCFYNMEQCYWNTIIENYPDVGVEENLNKREVKVYPNPVTDRLNVESKENVAIQIFDSKGSLVVNRNLSSRSRLDISYLPSGFYLLKVKGSDFTFSKRLIKE